jgi:putative ABC transport system permease protein
VSPKALLRLGFRSLFLHELRSTLSILGVFFGVAAVAPISSAGEGARREAIEQLGALGIGSITVKRRPTQDAKAPGGHGLPMRDTSHLERVVPNLLGVAGVRAARLEPMEALRHELRGAPRGQRSRKVLEPTSQWWPTLWPTGGAGPMALHRSGTM